MTSPRYLTRYRPGRLPWWYQWIEKQCVEVHALHFRPWYDKRLPWIDVLKAHIQAKKVHFAVTQSCSLSTPSQYKSYSSVKIPQNMQGYDCLLVFQFLPFMTKLDIRQYDPRFTVNFLHLLGKTVHFIISAGDLTKERYIALPAHKESKSQWEKCRENWNYFRVAAM